MKKYITSTAYKRINREIQKLLKKQSKVGKEKGQSAGEVLTNWHDNFAYEQLGRDFQIVNKQINELQDILSGAETISVVEQNEIVAIGNTVDYKINGKEKSITIGSYGESEVEMGLISYSSPLGSLLIDLKKGDVKTGKINSGIVEIEVIMIYPPSYKYMNLQQEL